MTAEVGIRAIVDALGLPSEARVDTRVPKKLLLEQGAPTPADKRAIQDGIDELQWLAACKPTTIGVPLFTDDQREYLEIAIVACAFRTGAKTTRLIELIHRAIPYPVLLIASGGETIAVSAAHKRRAENEAGKVVVDRIVSSSGLEAENLGDAEHAFMANIALAQLPRRDLFTLYEGWLSRIEALNAARLTGSFVTLSDTASIESRRIALDANGRLGREIAGLRAKAAREKRLNRRIDLNLNIKRLIAEAEENKKFL